MFKGFVGRDEKGFVVGGGVEEVFDVGEVIVVKEGGEFGGVFVGFY